MIDNSFRIVAEVIYNMGDNPTHSQKKMIDEIASIIAKEHTLCDKKSRLEGVYFKNNKYTARFQRKGKIISVYGKTDSECYTRLVRLRDQYKNK